MRDGEDDGQPRVALGTLGAEQKGKRERDRSERVAGIVDEVG
ncbi:MAG TPA: hypothetical protein VIH71_06500 [Solirubrobacteraceae bacterium]